MRPLPTWIERWDGELGAVMEGDPPVELLADGLGDLTSSLWVPDAGYLLIGDRASGRIDQWSAGTGVRAFAAPEIAAGAAPGSGPGGMALESRRSLLVADGARRRLARVDLRSGRWKTVTNAFEGRAFAWPHDVTRTRGGVVFFTDAPAVTTPAGPDPVPFRGVYRLDARGRLSVVDGALSQPRGIALSPDERTLYVTQSEPTRSLIMAYALDGKGQPGSSRILHDATDLAQSGAAGRLDGLAVSAEGTLFVAAPGGLLILTAEGRRLGRVALDGIVSSCCFGDDGYSLYLTAGARLARLQLKIPGFVRHTRRR